MKIDFNGIKSKLTKIELVAVVLLVIAAVFSLIKGWDVTLGNVFVLAFLFAVYKFLMDNKLKSNLEKVLKEIGDREYKVGNIENIKEGDTVYFDGKIIECDDLTVNQERITGAEDGVEKTDKADTKGHYSKNIVFAGSKVLTGEAKVEVIATGGNVELLRGTLGYYINKKAECATYGMVIFAVAAIIRMVSYLSILYWIGNISLYLANIAFVFGIIYCLADDTQIAKAVRKIVKINE